MLKKNEIAKLIYGNEEKKLLNNYYRRFAKNSFVETDCTDSAQFEAAITRMYHTIEKGLSYEEYRPGFGEENVRKTVRYMKAYGEKYDTSAFFYETGLSVLKQYIEKNRQHGYENEELAKAINELPGRANDCGGTIKFIPDNDEKIEYLKLVENRHSIRHFSDKPVDMEVLTKAIEIAQLTPSACNRQGWISHVIDNKELIKKVLENQNGNRGFGHEFDKLILVTGDLRYFNRDRELFQVYVDGGLYSMRLMDALYYKNIAACPLSASLTLEQESNISKLLGLHDYEVPIIFIGVGNYPENCQTTKSARHEPRFVVHK